MLDHPHLRLIKYAYFQSMPKVFIVDYTNIAMLPKWKNWNDSTLFMNCYLNFLPLFPVPYFVLLQHIFHLFKKVSFLFFLFLSFAGFYTPLCVVIPQCSIKCIENQFSLLCVYFFYCWKNMIDIRKMLFDIYSRISVLNNTLE